MGTKRLKKSTILKRAKALIEDPRNWTQNRYVRKDKAAPNGTGYRSCALGAIRLTVGDDPNPSESSTPSSKPGRAAAWALHEASQELFGYQAHNINDRGSRKTAHAKVMKVYDAAIAAAKAAGE